jgi:methyl-accepting chemotaxis protein
LATRSAEAAKEIKNIVERATSKANEGKDIANDMINGYKNLNQNITHTINLISDIEMASKEQLEGIEQINDAVNILDTKTQENAIIASETNNIAMVTHQISKLVVSNADSKEFVGKDKIVAKKIELNSFDDVKEEKSPKIEKVKRDEVKKEKTKIVEKIAPTIIKATKESTDEWESF